MGGGEREGGNAAEREGVRGVGGGRGMWRRDKDRESEREREKEGGGGGWDRRGVR